MSSPSNSLRKTKRSPLSNSGRPKIGVPFRQTDDLTSESPLPPRSQDSYAHYSLDSHTHKAIIDGLRHSKSTVESRGRGSSGSSDAELLVSMAQRLGQVERELLLSKREVIEKNECIHRLEAKIAALQATQRKSRDEEVQYLQRQCQALQHQVDDMEEFLNDYGMVWVGTSGEQSHDNQVTSGGAGSGLWSPSSSLPPEQQNHLNFDLIIKNIKELNILAGEGSSEVTRTSKGAELKTLEAVPLTLYNNGLSLYAGPFRPYSDPSTQRVIRDLTDGYFPSELQPKYPEGVPLRVNDQRDVFYTRKSALDYFPGSGQTLGGDKGPSRLMPAGCVLRSEPVPEGLKQSLELAGDRLSMDQFLSKLPSSVLKGGRVLSIRADVRDRLVNDSQTGSATRLKLVETQVLEEMKSRLEVAESERPRTPSSLTTLRVKAEDGEQTYVLKMKCTETIGDVRKYIDKLRYRGNDGSSEYLLKTTFPHGTLTDPSITLRQCGLVPTATLYMAKTTGQKSTTTNL